MFTGNPHTHISPERKPINTPIHPASPASACNGRKGKACEYQHPHQRPAVAALSPRRSRRMPACRRTTVAIHQRLHGSVSQCWRNTAYRQPRCGPLHAAEAAMTDKINTVRSNLNAMGSTLAGGGNALDISRKNG